MNAPSPSVTVTLTGSLDERWSITPGVVDDDAIDAYETSHSLSLALAISGRTGWPVVLHLAHFDRQRVALVRAWAQMPSGRLVDIHGCGLRSVAEGALAPTDALHEVSADEAPDLMDQFAEHLPPQDALLAGTMAQVVIERCQNPG